MLRWCLPLLAGLLAMGAAVARAQGTVTEAVYGSVYGSALSLAVSPAQIVLPATAPGQQGAPATVTVAVYGAGQRYTVTAASTALTDQATGGSLPPSAVRAGIAGGRLTPLQAGGTALGSSDAPQFPLSVSLLPPEQAPEGRFAGTVTLTVG